MFKKKLKLLLITLQISMTICAFYKGAKPIQQPRSLPPQLKYQKPSIIKPQQFEKKFSQQKTPLFKQQSCIVPNQKRSFYQMSENERLNLRYGKRAQIFEKSHRKIQPPELKERDFKIPLELLMPKDAQERDIFIQNLLRNAINQIDEKNFFSSEYTLPLHLVQILSSYAANKNNIYQIPAKIDFSSSGWQSVSLHEDWLNKGFENNIKNFIDNVEDIRFPLTKGFWGIFNRKTITNLTLNNPHYRYSQARSVILMFIFEKELQIARDIIEQRKKHGDYDSQTINAIETMLADIQEKVQALFERSEYRGVYTANYRKKVPSPIWDSIKEYIDTHYFDDKLARIKNNMPEGIDLEREIISQEEKQALTRYLNNLRNVINEFHKQE